MRRFAPVLAAFLLLQWSAAFGHCRALDAEARAAMAASAICVVHPAGLAAEGPAGPANPALAADWDCPACVQGPMLDDAAPPRRTAEAGAAWIAWVPWPKPAAVPALGPRAPPPPARAPPTT